MIGELGYVSRAFVSDTWAVIVAPTRLRRSEAITLGVVMAGGALLFAFDEDIQEAIRRNRDHHLLSAVEDAGHELDYLALMGNTNKFWMAGIAAGYAFNQPKLQRIAEELLFSHWIAGATRKTVGFAIGRMRPEEGFGAYEFRFMEGSSFPSGHSSTIIQLATVLAHHIDSTPIDVLLYGLAGTVVYERISTEKHWTSDSVLGALWGYAVARIVINRRETGRLDFVRPFVRPGEIGVSISTN